MNKPFKKLMKNKALLLLLLAGVVMLFGMLGTPILWTSENRISSIAWQMLWSNDYWHPTMYWVPYYDKPLMTYWLVALSAKLFGGLNGFTLRFPSAVAGLLCVFLTYKIGKNTFSKSVGLIAGWLLLTTFYFVFFSRIAFSDVFNLAGILLAVFFYLDKKDTPNFLNYLIFFLICALTSLCKGLMGFVIPILVILPMLFYRHAWRKHLKISLLIALLIGVFVYTIPFLISSYHLHASNSHAYGLLEVYRENVLRFFKPFDHQDPIYTYFLYFPIYSLPWCVLLPAVLYDYIKHFKTYRFVEKWPLMAAALIFLFFTLSNSRRTYYILPMVPFALFAISIWLNKHVKPKWIKASIAFFYSLIALWFVIIHPLYYLKHNTDKDFAGVIYHQAISMDDKWSSWQIREFNAENVVFYLQPQNSVKALDIQLAKQLITQYAKNNAKALKPMIWIMSNEFEKALKSLLSAKASAIKPKPLILTNRDYIAVLWNS